MSLRRRVDQLAQMRAELYYISEILHCKMLFTGRKIFLEIKMILTKNIKSKSKSKKK